MARRNTGDANHIRLLNDGLIDGEGGRWDRITTADFYLTQDEAPVHIESAWRFLRTRGTNNRCDIVERADFLELVSHSPDHRVQAFRAADGSGRVIATIDTSDC